MKKMTKIGFLILLSALTFTACSEDNGISPLIDEQSSLLDFMFLATANDAPTTKPDWKGGKKCNITAVAVADLPAAVTGYVSTNYAGSTIEHAGKLENGTMILKVKKADATYVGLVFDAAGVFVTVKTHKGGKHGTDVAIADLPAALTAYITANYAGSTIKKAVKNDEGKILVIIQKADASLAGLGFNADGSFISEMTKKDGRNKKKG